jgi:site-specific recombinase XerD
LRKETVAILRAWLRERNVQPEAPLFPNLRGKQLSRDGVQYLLAKHVASARQNCPSLKTKRVSPHVLRHYTGRRNMPNGIGGDCVRPCWCRAFS